MNRRKKTHTIARFITYEHIDDTAIVVRLINALPISNQSKLRYRDEYFRALGR